jgi:hypothetical protein
MPKLEELNIAVSSPSQARLALEHQAYVRRLKQVDDLVEETVFDNSASGPPSVIVEGPTAESPSGPEINEHAEIKDLNVDEIEEYPKVVIIGNSQNMFHCFNKTQDASPDDCAMEEAPGDDGHRPEPDSPLKGLAEETVWDDSLFGPLMEPTSVPEVNKPAEFGIVNVDDIPEDPKVAL